MKLRNHLVDGAIRFPRTVVVGTVLVVVALATLLPRLTVDTDPESMLPADNPARLFHHLAKKEFNLHDMLVVGVVNESNANGVFQARSLERIYKLTRRIESFDGVIRDDVMSLASVDNITQGGPGVVRFAWMMNTPPKTDAQARAIRDAARNLPVIDGTLVSKDGRAAAIYVPLRSKSDSHRIARKIEKIIAGFDGSDRFFITGLPVAEDTFGIEMFRQMGIAAPAAGLIVFLLMLLFFRSISLVIAPMIIAILTVSATMSLLVGLGYTIHIMSSMIPIFLMPIAVANSVHILSEFSDLYSRVRDKEKTIRLVMDDLYQPMLYTSLTTAAGFGSLAFTPVPPARVFGVFVAIGVALAFIMTVTFVPAYVVLLNDRQLNRLARTTHTHEDNWFSRALESSSRFTLVRWKSILAVTVVIIAVSVYGIFRIQINDNPVRWFRGHHRIRVADRVLNDHFAGTYNAFLVFHHKAAADSTLIHQSVDGILANARNRGIHLDTEWKEAVRKATRGNKIDINLLISAADDDLDNSEDSAYPVWEDIVNALEKTASRQRFFQSPAALTYIEDMQRDLAASNLVGKSISLADIVKTVHRELREGNAKHFTIPGSQAGIAQTLVNYQSSHRPDDLWHFVTPDYHSANIWLQLRSGDNQHMAAVEERVARYVDAHPLPAGTNLNWAGLTYLNVVWQNKMVHGMLNSLLGSFAIVFIMMLILFRSMSFAILAMLPLSVTIAFIYGVIGLVGKDYDMPVAVLSSLTLGLSVDFAIHFLERIRAVCRETNNWNKSIAIMFREPARAIVRNAIVISVGFLPLLISPLVPYNTVGFFLATIMIVSAAVTLLLLPALMHPLRKKLFRGQLPPDQEHEFVTEAGRRTLRNATIAVLIGAAVLFAAAQARSQTSPRIATIIDRANQTAYYAGDDGRASVRMTITDAQGRTRIRQFTILRKDLADGGDQDYVVLFSRPAGVRGTVFLVKKHAHGNDDRWLYMPGLDLVKRIAAGDKRISFMGSNFLYEDVSGRGIDEDTHKLVKTTPGQWVILNTPKDPGSVEFASWTVWIDRKTYLPVKMEYVDNSGTVYRRIETLAVQTIQGHPTATKMRASDLRNGGNTVSEFRNIKYNIGIPRNVFTERTLRNPPRSWFRRR